ncbi:hypothetical protein [Fodinibacter luteus]|uniref:hypothetical protein n=1 Tax=Fodinibacter luteus TaxID=552064 RepID=UPI0031E756F0
MVAAPAYAASGAVLAPSFTRLGAACLSRRAGGQWQYEYWVELDIPAPDSRRVKIVSANLSAVPLTLTAAYDSVGTSLGLGGFWMFGGPKAFWLRLVFDIPVGATGGALEINYLWGGTTGPVTRASSVLANPAVPVCPLPAQPPST